LWGWWGHGGGTSHEWTRRPRPRRVGGRGNANARPAPVLHAAAEDSGLGSGARRGGPADTAGPTGPGVSRRLTCGVGGTLVLTACPLDFIWAGMLRFALLCLLGGWCRVDG
jgi:hypothetical protein